MDTPTISLIIPNKGDKMSKPKYLIMHNGVTIDTANSVDEARDLAVFWVQTLNTPEIRIILN